MIKDQSELGHARTDPDRTAALPDGRTSPGRPLKSSAPPATIRYM